MKNPILLLSALTSLLFASSAAYADTYNFTLTPGNGASTTFSLNTAGVTFSSDSVFTAQSLNSTAYSRIDLFNGGGFGPFDLGVCSVGDINGCYGDASYFTGPALDTQAGNGLTIYTGTFNLLNGSQDNQPATLTVVHVSTPAPTPEPSSLALLGTGILGMFGVMKRRLS